MDAIETLNRIPGRARRPRRAAGGTLVVLVLGGAALGAAGVRDGEVPQDPQPYWDSIPGTAVRFEMVPVEAGTVTVPAAGGREEIDVGAFWIGRTEVTWDAYDIYAFQLDLTREERAAGVDAVTRPTRPYGAPDWGFGHEGYPAMSVTYRAAAQFCAWLTEKTGTTYRLPTDAEWSLAAQGGVGLDGVTGDLLDAVAWYRANSAGSTHPVAARRADGLGLFDLLGNVAEWVAGAEGPLVRGGSYRDLPPDVGPNARARQAPAWNARDPQIPKSPWWLSDGPFVGFRIVREP